MMGTIDIGLKRRLQVIFQRDSAVKSMTVFDDAFRKFQSDFGRNPSLAFVDSHFASRGVEDGAWV